MKIRNVSLCALSLFPALGFADITQAPPNFPFGSETAVFVDFTAADYAITYDGTARTAIVQSRIKFQQSVAGHAIFDLVPGVLEAKLDGEVTVVRDIALPGNASKVKVVEKNSNAGEHTLEIRSELKQLVTFESAGVRSAFWTTDLEDRGYLEKYLPANLEYDQVPMTLTLKFAGMTGPQDIFTNGTVTREGNGSAKIVYPSWYNASSIFFHTAPKDSFSVEASTYTSVDGRILPITVYSRDRSLSARGVTKSKDLLRELENDYGAWPHAALTIYLAGSGGMEYCGATMTEASALSHEMFHSYHARGMMPANGDAGWMDEAIAMWRDNGYNVRSTPGFGTARLSNRSPYIRYTPMGAYSQGEQFMGYLAGQTGTEASAFKGFLRQYFEKFKYTTATTDQFKSELEQKIGKSLTPAFTQYIFGGGRTLEDRLSRIEAEPIKENPVHKRQTVAELMELL